MSAPVLILVIVGGWTLLAVALGALAALAGVHFGRHRSDESGLGDEDVASILGYPMYPVWQARKNAQTNGEADHPEEPVA
jgi:hypothetical protein